LRYDQKLAAGRPAEHPEKPDFLCHQYLRVDGGAFELPAHHPVKITAFMKQEMWGLRQSLIVFQFVISVFLIVSTFIMQGRLSYIRSRKLGYDRDHVLKLPMSRKMLPQISLYESDPHRQQGCTEADPVDEDFIRTTGLQLVAGEGLALQDMRNATPDAQARIFHFILNESAARQLGWTPREAIGKRMFLDDSRFDGAGGYPGPARVCGLLFQPQNTDDCSRGKTQTPGELCGGVFSFGIIQGVAN